MRDAPTDWRARDGSRLRADHVNRLTALDVVARLLDAGADPEQAVHGPDALGLDVLRPERLGHAVLSRRRGRRRRFDEALVAHGADVEWAPKPVEGTPPKPFGDNTGLTPLMVALNGGKGLLMDGGPGDIREGQDRDFPRARQPHSRGRRTSCCSRPARIPTP